MPDSALDALREFVVSYCLVYFLLCKLEVVIHPPPGRLEIK